MSAVKYIVTNGNEYVVSGGKKKLKKTTNIKKATLFRYEQAQNFIRCNLGNDIRWTYRRVNNKPDGKNYVITNGSNYVCENGITFKFDEATRFNSESDALHYVDAHGGFFDETYIITDNSEVVNFEERRQFTREQLITLGINNVQKSKRIVFVPEVRQKVYEKNNKTCAICGKHIKYKDFTIDHILPLDRGGTNDLDNLQPTCSVCNGIKSNSKDSEFVKSISSILSYQIENGNASDVMDGIIKSCVVSYLSNMFGSDVANNIII